MTRSREPERHDTVNLPVAWHEEMAAIAFETPPPESAFADFVEAASLADLGDVS